MLPQIRPAGVVLSFLLRSSGMIEPNLSRLYDISIEYTKICLNIQFG